MSRKFKFH